tara:strand:+ start:615 stop:872 length:258 start_codon:yes stop_codon:yes gene_type:complete
MKETLKLYSSQLKAEDIEKFEDIEEELKQVRNDIDFLYGLIQPNLPEVSTDHDYINDTTIEIPEELYKLLYKYCENKKFIFMAIA